MIYAAILAGGKGSRIERYSIPKQFVNVGGSPVIVHTLKKFIQNERFQIIYIAVHNEWIDYATKIISESFSQTEIERIKIVSGGKERLDSFFNIISDIQDTFGVKNDDILICHDSVRPFVTKKIINDCIDATFQFGQALTVIPTIDTIFRISDGFIDGTYERNEMCNGQTPSGFTIKTLLKVYDSFSEEEKRNITGTMQLFVKSGLKIRAVYGNTENFKITTDNDFDLAEIVFNAKRKKMQVSILDCTLRDGGIAVNFDFGNDRMQDIKNVLESSCVEYIECGYLDSKKGFDSAKSCFNTVEAISNSFLYSGKKNNATYLAMIDYGTFDVNLLPEQKSIKNNVDGFRLAFHKECASDAIEAGKIILQKGYRLFVQPMVATRYSSSEFQSLIEIVNKTLPSAESFYIVDSFGQMDSSMLREKFEIADRYVSPSMKIGLHAHNNRQMAFSNACELLECNSHHDLIIDSSIMGMGKGAGNVNTELLMPTLVKYSDDTKKYDAVGIYSLIRSYFSHLQTKFPWGYNLDYYLSSLYGISPSYVKVFISDERVTTDILIELLKGIPEEKKYACDRNFASSYLHSFFSSI